MDQLDLFAEYHRFGDDVRDAEIAGALGDNLELAFVRRLHLLSEGPVPEFLAKHAKCQVISLTKRLTMQEIFALADASAAASCRVLINSDIVLDANCALIPQLMRSEEFYVLRRLEADGKLNVRAGLDAWCWAERCRIAGADFEMGRVNCDLRMNQLAWEAYGDGLSCPSLSFSIHHRHSSQRRPGTSNLARREQFAVGGASRKISATVHPSFEEAME